MRTKQLRPGITSATFAAAVAVAVVVVSLGVTVTDLVRLAVWFGSGLLMLARASRRPEPTSGWGAIGTGNIIVAVGWMLRLDDPTARFGAWPTLVIIVGLSFVGLGSVLLGPNRGHRTAVLDGLLAAFAIGLATAVGVLVQADGVVTTVMLLATVGLVATTFVSPAVTIVSLLSGYVTPSRGALRVGLGVLTVQIAGTATALGGIHGDGVGGIGTVAWIVSPIMASAVVLGTDPIYGLRVAARRDVLAPSRITILLLLSTAPALVALWSSEATVRQLGLAASFAAATVLTVRVATSVRYEMAWAREVADVRFDALVENAGTVLALADAGGKLFYVSRPVERTFSIPQADLLGRDVLELIHQEDRSRFSVVLQSARERAGTPVVTQVRVMDGGGKERHVELAIVDLMDLEGVNALSLSVRDITERVLLELELVKQIRFDELTGMLTRHVLTDRVEHVLTRRDNSCALLYMDINDFKLINDGFGHAAGDHVLAVIGERIRGVLRTSDSAGRLGGDEFAILLEELPDAPLSDVLLVADRVHEVCAEPIVVADGERLNVRMSVGVAMGEHGRTSEELFAAADAAMYLGKRQHRATVVYEQGMNPSSRSRFEMMRDLEGAIDAGELEMHYQPIHAVDTGRMEGVEALLRWNHPEYGWVAPNLVLDHAEQAGLTARMTIAIIEEISSDLRQWRDEIGHPLAVSLNLSAEQLIHVDPDDVLLRTVGSRSSGPSLTIEVTETSMLGDIAAAARVLEAFRAAGCHVAIDDFGTGYASIGYLRQLPIDRLKIDMEFITGLTADTAMDSFAAVINGLAHTLGMETVAEGVETSEQLEAVRSIGCEFVQGWLLGRAVPVQELIDAVHDGTLDVNKPAVRPAAPPLEPLDDVEEAFLGWSH